MGKGFYLRRDTPLRRWLESHRFSQEEFRQQIGVTSAYMSKVVNGHHPSANLALRICEVTGLKMEDLYPKEEANG